MRCFVAIELEQPLRDELARIQDELRNSVQQKARWTDPGAIHLTIQFLGEQGDAAVGAIRRALRSISVNPFSLTLGALGGFPSLERPRVLFAGLAGDLQHLDQLAHSVQLELRSLNIEPEERDFHPHLTLARIGETGPSLRRLERVPVQPLAQRVDRFVLIESTRSPLGSVYSVVETFGVTESGRS